MFSALEDLKSSYPGKVRIHHEKARINAELDDDLVSKALILLPDDSLSGIELATIRLAGTLHYDGEGSMRLLINAPFNDDMETLYSNVDKRLEKLEIQIGNLTLNPSLNPP